VSELRLNPVKGFGRLFSSAHLAIKLKVTKKK
jgi:hypothetical protein